MARECQEKNAQGLTMVAVGVNKAAEQYLILDDRTREELALLYNEQRLRPDEIAKKLGLSTYTVTQIILASRNQGKL